jgi:hypothetical protein
VEGSKALGVTRQHLRMVIYGIEGRKSPELLRRWYAWARSN